MTWDDLCILALTLYGEGRGESRKGQEAIAWVIFNRAKDPRWPKSPAAVALQRKQFSCWNNGDPNNYPMLKARPKDPAFSRCVAVIAGIYGGLVPDPTGGANHYHTTQIEPPYWAEADKVTKVIGNHIFYKL